jgi:hypothetical protein
MLKVARDAKKQRVFSVIGAESLSEREKDDFYATDPIAGEYLMKLEKLSHNIWECACGQGHLSKVFEKYGYNVKSTDLIDRGYGEEGINFLRVGSPFGEEEFSIITNPPYKLDLEFVKHSLRLVPVGCKVAMFLRLLFLEGQERRRLFDREPPIRVWVSSSRLNCANGGDFVKYPFNSAICYAWFIWEKGYKGETTLKWFN